MSGVRIRSSLFGGDSSIEFDDPPQWTSTTITPEALSAAIHEVYCHQNARMHSSPDHSASLILAALRGIAVPADETPASPAEER